MARDKCVDWFKLRADINAAVNIMKRICVDEVFGDGKCVATIYWTEQKFEISQSSYTSFFVIRLVRPFWMAG